MSSSGVAITDIGNGSIAQRLGFQRGDVIVSINDTDIVQTRDLERVMREPSRGWRVTIMRGGRQMSVTFGG